MNSQRPFLADSAITNYRIKSLSLCLPDRIITLSWSSSIPCNPVVRHVCVQKGLIPVTMLSSLEAHWCHNVPSWYRAADTHWPLSDQLLTDHWPVNTHWIHTELYCVVRYVTTSSVPRPPPSSLYVMTKHRGGWP